MSHHSVVNKSMLLQFTVYHTESQNANLNTVHTLRGSQRICKHCWQEYWRLVQY